jgi:hypothetical protein
VVTSALSFSGLGSTTWLDTVAVGILWCSADLAGTRDNLTKFRRGLVVQGVALDQFHDDEGRAIGLSGIVHGDDVAGVEPGGGPDFAQKIVPPCPASFCWLSSALVNPW